MPSMPMNTTIATTTSTIVSPPVSTSRVHARGRHDARPISGRLPLICHSPTGCPIYIRPDGSGVPHVKTEEGRPVCPSCQGSGRKFPCSEGGGVAREGGLVRALARQDG